MISFGGGIAMLPLLERMLVDRWITYQQFLDILAISQATPGAFAVNMATYVGALATPNAFLGSALTTTALSIPGFLLSFFIAYPMLNNSRHPYLSILMKYLAPTSLGLILYTGLNLFFSELSLNQDFSKLNIKNSIIILISFIFLYFKIIKNTTLIFIVAIIGAIFSFL